MPRSVSTFLHILQDFGQQLLIVLEYAEGDLCQRLKDMGPLCSEPGGELSEEQLAYAMHLWSQMLKVGTASIVALSVPHNCTFLHYGALVGHWQLLYMHICSWAAMQGASPEF